MPEKNMSISVQTQGVRYKLLIAYVLMSIIPLLVSVYLLSQFFTLMSIRVLGQISIVMLITVIISWFGLLLAKTIIDSIIDLSVEARGIAEGRFDKEISISGEDEVGSLGGSINSIVSGIKKNIAELKGYTEQTQEINVNIYKNMAILNDLLQISDLISLSQDVVKIAEAIVGKIPRLYENGYAAVYLSMEKEGEFVPVSIVNEKDRNIPRDKIILGHDFLGALLEQKKTLIMDSSSGQKSAENAFRNKNKLDNFAAIPLVVSGRPRGLFMAGNSLKDFIFTKEDIAILTVLSKQMVLAVENKLIARQAEVLSYRDELSGLYNRAYIITRLNEEIDRAILYQRPCSFILIDLDNFKEYGNQKGQLAAENTIIKAANLIKSVLVEPVDKAGRIGDDEFAVIFPEKSKKNAIQVAEIICRGIMNLNLSSDPKDRVSASIGVSSNPLDGSSGAHIMDKARSAVRRAKSAGKNRVAI